MATLTETAQKVRLAIKYSIFGFVAITTLWFAAGAAIRYYKALNPPPPPLPTVDFGLLPAIQFPTETGRPALELELPKGQIPPFPDRMRVFFAPTKRSGFMDPKKAIATANKLDFLFKPDQPTETYYVWRKQDILNSRLEMNIISGHYSLTRAWQNNPALLSLNNFVSDDKVIYDVVNFLQRAGLAHADAVGNEKIRYLKASGGDLVSALSLSDAEFVQVDMFRNPYKVINKETDEVLEEYSFYRPDPEKGLIRTIVSGSTNAREQIISQEYKYTKVDYANFGTYPIKTGEEAWQELQQGEGFVTIGSPTSGTLKIRRILLGYYDSDLTQSYAMPIYVFLGDKNFVAYVSAIKNEWMGK
jgi:hypothetical protein